MGTDSELLELAAKAAGLQECGFMGPAFMHVKDNAFVEWNPLTDDGDALRLAVDLNVDLHINERAVELFSGDLDDCITQPCIDGDKRAATRLAITRAAAEIGRAMP